MRSATEPTAERRITLLSAGIASHRQATREECERLAAEVDWSRLARTLRLRRLLPGLGPRIIELANGHASDDFSDAVEQSIEAGRRQGAFLLLVCHRVIAALAEAGIRSTPLKGPALGEAIYGDQGRRFSNDVDLLVAPAQLQAAVEVVRGLGYSAPTDHVEKDGLPQLHFALIHERGELPTVELHWRIHWYEPSFASECLLPPDIDQRGAWRPAPADELAALLLFYARDGFVDLRLATDLSAWWDTFGDRLDDGALNRVLRAYPALAPAISASARVAARTVGLPMGKILVEQPPIGLRGRMAIRLANPNPHASEPQIFAEMGLIDGLLMPPGGFGSFMRRQLLPPREVLDAQDQRALKRRARAWFGYPTRALVRFGVLGRYALALARLPRSPETVL